MDLEYRSPAHLAVHQSCIEAFRPARSLRVPHTGSPFRARCTSAPSTPGAYRSISRIRMVYDNHYGNNPRQVPSPRRPSFPSSAAPRNAAHLPQEQSRIAPAASTMIVNNAGMGRRWWARAGDNHNHCAACRRDTTMFRPSPRVCCVPKSGARNRVGTTNAVSGPAPSAHTVSPRCPHPPPRPQPRLGSKSAHGCTSPCVLKPKNKCTTHIFGSALAMWF
ncbi:hypothetical protein EJ06DRAFT_531641 [Trichodelitschia bisporula]|uniref:Uncharacterized protein n=1 Tax=Trichodelitschia bisporula TaxID=703511 RepID=A0A6G1HTY4_9PEZI|nr:hypothetical protein EJ06DRAFT_531641 [Trichodelitschia bisporula]